MAIIIRTAMMATVPVTTKEIEIIGSVGCPSTAVGTLVLREAPATTAWGVTAPTAGIISQEVSILRWGVASTARTRPGTREIYPSRKIAELIVNTYRSNHDVY